ncbi:hypothetical protein OIV83_001107 [Microbotryomycetes sp. JL201]|nr:hypothetical protein OIV83_001107 [Microbotryomycetes sp. JL201]
MYRSANESPRKGPPAALDLTHTTTTRHASLSNGQAVSPLHSPSDGASNGPSPSPSPSSIMFPSNYNARSAQRTSVQSSRPKPLSSKTSAQTPRRSSNSIVPGTAHSSTHESGVPVSPSSSKGPNGMTVNLPARISDYSSRRSPLPSPTQAPRPSRRTSNDSRTNGDAPMSKSLQADRRQSRDRLVAPQSSVTPAATGSLQASVLDRPRPKTPDATLSNSATSRQSTSAETTIQADRAEDSSSRIEYNSGGDGLLRPTFSFDTARDQSLDLSLQPEAQASPIRRQDSFGRDTQSTVTNTVPRLPDGEAADKGVARSPSTSKPSVLDRPRPKTPDLASTFLAGTTHVTPARASKPTRSDASTSGPPSVASTPSKLGSTPAPSPAKEWKGSVLDRPRPRTPDAQVLLNRPSPTSSSKLGLGKPQGTSLPRPPSFSRAPLDTQAKPSMIPFTSPANSPTMTTQSPVLQQRSVLPAQSPSAASDWNRRIESYRGARDVERPSSDMPRSTSGVSSSSALSSLAPPTLSLDLDFSNSSTMFDLTSLLKLGGDEDAAAATTPRAERRPDAVHLAAADSSNPVETPTTTSIVQDPPFQRPDGAALSLVPSRGGATTPLGRKEPPKVDMMLELELELEKSIALNKPEPKLALSAPTATALTTSSEQIASRQEPRTQSTAPKRRKNSLASLLSFASSSAAPSDESSSRRHNESFDLPRRDDRTTRPSVDIGTGSRLESSMAGSFDSRPTDLTSSTSGRSLTSSQSHGRPGMSLDKSLPPPPTNSVAPPPQRRTSYSAQARAGDTTDAAPGNSPSRTSIGKQLSKLRARANQGGGSSGFQVVSATTTRKPFTEAESSSSAANSAASIYPVPIDKGFGELSTSASQPSTSVGRRLLGKLGGVGNRKSSAGSIGSNSNDPSSAFASDMSVDDKSAASNKDGNGLSGKLFGKRPRRSSISNLLNGGGTNASETSQRRSSAAKLGGPVGASMLGMSLAAARKSADMLTSWQKKDKTESTQAENRDRGMDRGERRSFDLLSSRKDGARKSGSDDYREFSSSKLSPVQHRSDTKVQPGFRAPSRSTRPETPSSVTSSDSEDVSYDDDDEIDRRVYGAALPSHASVAVAQRVVRPDGTSSSSASPKIDVSPSLSRGSATPVLVQSAMLRQQQTSSLSTTTPQIDKPQMDATDADTDAARSTSRSSDIFSTPQLIQTPDTAQTDRTTLGPFAVETSLTAEWMMLDNSLTEYTSAMVGNVAERGNVLVNVLIPFLKREEASPARRSSASVTSIQRDILFRWLSLLTTELREMQPAHRGACLESVAAIAESHFLSAAALQDDPFAQARYRAAIVEVLSFAVEKLNEKAVYANTLVFSGRVMALAFFRIEGVAFKLLRALPRVKRQCFSRVLAEAGIKEDNLPTVNLELFPAHLWSLCLRDMKSYLDLLLPSGRKSSSQTAADVDDEALVRDANDVVEMAGNWLIRWTASDSDLPFAFYRAYHRQLAHHLVPMDQRRYLANQHPLDPASVVTAPGALFLAASLLEKCDSLVHRNLRSVTSIGPNNNNFNTNDSANLSFGQKPKILELANRRLVQTMLDIVGGPPATAGSEHDVSADTDVRRHAFSRMLPLWIRASMKRTSMWDTRSVFILLDLIEGLIYTLSYPAPSTRDSDEDLIVPKPSESSLDLFDIPFIFSCVKIILGNADNTVALMRTIAFIYAHFEIFTLRPADRDELCEHVILDETLFERMYLHWNAGVRGYFIRLLVWRLSRLGITDAEQHPDRPRDPRILAIFGLMNVRLEAIRKRHDELEPVQNLPEDDDFFKPKRSTICSTRGVKEAPFTVDELAGLFESDTEDDEDDSQELVNSNVPVAENGRKATGAFGAGSSTGGIKEVATVARVVSWLKGGLGKKTGSGGGTVRRDELYAEEDFNSSPRTDAQDDGASGQSGFDESSEDTRSSTTASAPTTADTEFDLAPHSTPDTMSKRAKRSSRGPAFFAFEFENGLSPRSDMPDEESPTPRTGKSHSDAASVVSTGTSDTVFPLASGLGRSTLLDPNSAPPPHAAVVSPRVSARFSKRISILPPAALEMFKEGVPVPPIPAQYRQDRPRGYDRKLHPYAVRGLRDYEDALDEWTDWVARLQEEEDEGRKHNRGFVDTVPRLAVSWPQSFEEGA